MRGWLSVPTCSWHSFERDQTLTELLCCCECGDGVWHRADLVVTWCGIESSSCGVLVDSQLWNASEELQAFKFVQCACKKTHPTSSMPMLSQCCCSSTLGMRTTSQNVH